MQCIVLVTLCMCVKVILSKVASVNRHNSVLYFHTMKSFELFLAVSLMNCIAKCDSNERNLK